MIIDHTFRRVRAQDGVFEKYGTIRRNYSVFWASNGRLFLDEGCGPKGTQ